MTAQEIFNKVYLAVRAQGGPSKNNGTCAYRGNCEGHKCAAGHLLDDEHYRKDMEGLSTSAETVRAALAASGVDMVEHGAMVDEMQRIHDCGYEYEYDDNQALYKDNFVLYWEVNMGDLAKKFGLTMPQVPA